MIWNLIQFSSRRRFVLVATTWISMKYGLPYNVYGLMATRQLTDGRTGGQTDGRMDYLQVSQPTSQSTSQTNQSNQPVNQKVITIGSRNLSACNKIPLPLSLTRNLKRVRERGFVANNFVSTKHWWWNEKEDDFLGQRIVLTQLFFHEQFFDSN